jgi:hypothetical protein
MTTRRHVTTGLVAGACVLALGGCAGSQDDAAGSVAERLLTSAGQGDGAAACDVLAPPTRSELEKTAGKPCEEAVLDEDLTQGDGPARVTVFDSMAQVVRGSQTVFLSRFDDAWLVVAAACTPVPGKPYDCRIGLP